MVYTHISELYVKLSIHTETNTYLYMYRCIHVCKYPKGGCINKVKLPKTKIPSQFKCRSD